MQKPKRILVLQLARLGDIYQTWPVLRAIKRTEPECELHFVTRSRFSVAAPQDGVIDRIWKLDTRDVLTPLVDEIPNHDESIARLGRFIDELAASDFDRVVNLSFSPFSSYLTSEVAKPGCDVRGYTRTADGYLSIPDDGSAYFYAQVGVGKSNRVHVSDLFAHVAGVELCEQDWSAGVDVTALTGASVAAAGTDAIVVHIGASQLAKTFSGSKWLQVIKGLCREHTGRVVVVGSEEEAGIAAQACAISGENKPVDLVGKTTLGELVEIVRGAKCVIGGDSAPIQIASLTKTPCLNLSFPQVSFWETGPRAAGSRILPITNEDSISSERIVDEAMRIVRGKAPGASDVVRVAGPMIPFVETIPQLRTFEWELLRALYMSEAFPPPPGETFLLGVQRLTEVNSLVIDQLEALRRLPTNKTAAAIIDRCDEVMDQIVGFVPEIAPMVRWFRTERLRIGPMQVASLIEATAEVHARFEQVLELYGQTSGGTENSGRGENGHDDVILE
ncbi:MAG: glycosyltransferase family 9 protein [Bdellovibrionota bacterium]